MKIEPVRLPHPDPVHATPHDLPAQWDDDVAFWRPGGLEALRYIGWRWVLLLPTLIAIAALGAVAIHPRVAVMMSGIGWKLEILALAAPVIMLRYLKRQAIKHRHEPFCIHCGYSLVGLPDHHDCPECGRRFDLKVVQEYRNDPYWFAHRYKNRRKVPHPDEPFAAGPVRRTRRDGV